MAEDFNLFARIIPDKKQLEKDLAGVTAKTKTENGGGEGDKKNEENTEATEQNNTLLGGLTKVMTLVAGLLTVFEPILKIFEGFVKALQLFFIPLNVLLLKTLSPILEEFVRIGRTFAEDGLEAVEGLGRSFKEIENTISIVGSTLSNALKGLTSPIETLKNVFTGKAGTIVVQRLCLEV